MRGWLRPRERLVKTLPAQPLEGDPFLPQTSNRLVATSSHPNPHRSGFRFSANLYNSDMHACMHLRSSLSSHPPPTKEEAALPSLPFYDLIHASISLCSFILFFISHARVNLITQAHYRKEGEFPLSGLSLAMRPTDTEIDKPWSIQDHSLPIVLTFILILFFIIAFFTLHLFRYVMEYLHTIRQRPVATPCGLPTSIISSFPTFPYSSIKDEDIRHGNDKPECSVCLAEFSDDDELRMLTGCRHAFHLECIDLWLQTHTTCPICRRDLDRGNEKVEVIIQMPESDNGRREGEGEATAGRHEHRNSSKEDGSEEEGNS